MSWLLVLAMWCSPQCTQCQEGWIWHLKDHQHFVPVLGKQNPNNHERPAEKFKFGILRALLERLQLGELRRKPGSLAVRAVGVPWKIHPTTPSATRYSSPGDTSAKLPLTSNSNSGICFSTPYLPFSPYFQVVNWTSSLFGTLLQWCSRAILNHLLVFTYE